MKIKIDPLKTAMDKDELRMREHLIRTGSRRHRSKKDYTRKVKHKNQKSYDF